MVEIIYLLYHFNNVGSTTAVTSLLDYCYADSTEEKEEAIHNIGNWVIYTICSKILGLIGNYDGELIENVSQKTMGIDTTIVDYIFAAFESWMGLRKYEYKKIYIENIMDSFIVCWRSFKYHYNNKKNRVV